MTINLELLDVILAKIQEDPDHWDQGNWASAARVDGVCGTAYCVAGWAVHLTDPGAETVWYAKDGSRKFTWADMPDADKAWFKANPHELESGGVKLGNGSFTYYSDEGRRALGLGGATQAEDALALFNGSNSLTDLLSARDYLAEYGHLENWEPPRYTNYY